MKKCILTLACSRHILPLQFFEDPVVSQGFGLPYISRQDVRSELRQMAVDIKSDLMEAHRGKWATLALDGWKNPVTQHKHLTVLLFFCNEPSQPVFLRSFLLEDNRAASISIRLLEVLTDLDAYGITVVSVVTDNARCMLAATELVFQQRPTVLPLRCAAHVMNLIIKDAIRNVEFLKASFEILLDYIKRNIIKRYCETRWNSVYDRFVDLAKHLRALDEAASADILTRIDNAIAALSPFITVLNIAQKDGCDWSTLYKEFCKAVAKTSECGRDSLAAVAEKRRDFLMNPIVCLDLFVNEKVPLTEACERRLTKWLEALGICEFSQYICDREFHTVANTPRRLRLFLDHKVKSIAVSEAAVERCFNIHKLIHTPMRSSISDELVDDILFIRYNHSHKYDCFSAPATNDELVEIDTFENLDDVDD